MINHIRWYASCATIRWPCSRRISCKMGMNSGQYPLSSSSTSFTVNFLRRPGYITKEKKFLKQKYLILLMNFVCESVYELTSRLRLSSLIKVRHNISAKPNKRYGRLFIFNDFPLFFWQISQVIITIKHHNKCTSSSDIELPFTFTKVFI